jgi:hypothetical protein
VRFHKIHHGCDGQAIPAPGVDSVDLFPVAVEISVKIDVHYLGRDIGFLQQQDINERPVQGLNEGEEIKGLLVTPGHVVPCIHEVKGRLGVV